MKLSEVIESLKFLQAEYGDVELVLQDSPFNKHPELCKHESFFIIEETRDNKTEIVLRTWPY